MPSGDTPDLNLLFPQRTAAAEQKLFGRYTLKRVLGRGGMGIVWMAHDDELHRHVAMKFLPDMLIRDREAVNDLKRETRRSLDLTHHHIVRIYDFTQDDACAAIIMEYVDGETLSAMKTQQSGGCFSVSTIAAWAAHFCQALDYAHRQARVVHRDLKLANLMVNSRGDLKVTDFGISRSMSDSMTRVSMSNTAGTLAYMSPEQALGAPPAACDDVYAFGATIYDLLTGRPPFFRGNIQVQLETVIPPKMAERREELGNEGDPIPDLWEEAIAACLAKRPQNRPQSMGEIATLLGLGSPASGARTFLSAGSGSGGGPGTSSTRARTSPADDTATRTDAVPPNPQTTKKAVPGTRGTPYRSSARPTALRDVIPGYLDEPAEPPVVTPPPPATTPTRGKVGEPISSKLPVSVPPEPVVEPPAPEALVQPEIEAEPEPAVARTEEPQPNDEIADLVEAPPPPASAVAGEDEIAPSFEAGPASVEEIVVEPELEPEPIESLEEEKPAASAAEIAKEDHADFPTLFGEPLVLPQPPAEESLAIDLAEPESGDRLLSAEVAAEPGVELQREENPPSSDEAAATLVEEPRPSDKPATAPFLPHIHTGPAKPVPSSPKTPAREAAARPAQERKVPWMPIAAAAGVVLVTGLWMATSKDKNGQQDPRSSSTTPRPVQPTPVPAAEIESKLQQGRTLFANQKFSEAIVLLRGVQQLDSTNAEAAKLLAEIDRIELERAVAANRQQEIEGLLAKADSAMNREQWKEARAALEEVLKFDPQNAAATGQLTNLKDAEAEWARLEKERTAQLERDREQQRLAAIQAEQQAAAAAAAQARAQTQAQDRDREREAKEKERARTAAAEDDTPRKKPKATPRPQRVRADADDEDRPKRTAASREDQRPPAPSRTQTPPRSAPPATTPTKPRSGVFGAGPPGG